jgi:hypothetical protein
MGYKAEVASYFYISIVEFLRRYRVQTNVNREKFNRSEPKIGYRENRRNGVDRDKDANKNQKSQVNAEKGELV